MAQVTFAPVKTTARNLGGTVTYYIDGKLIAGVGATIPLASLDDYAQGSLIVGGAVDWNALTIGASGKFLASDGADATWETLAVGDLPAHASTHQSGGSDTVNHDSLVGFVSDEHVAHSGVTLTAGDGIQGGGTIAANRAFAVDVSDFAGAGLEDDGSENLRIAASAAGSGLTGGAGSALAVGAGDGITVNANDVAVNEAYAFTWSAAHEFQEDITTADGKFIGLGAAKGRIEYHDEAVDVVAVMDARLGIGTASPATNLHVVETAGVLPPNPDAIAMIVQDNAATSGYAALSLIGGELTGHSVLEFGDKDDRDVGRIYYRHASDSMQFYTNAQPRVTIDSAGNVGIGTASPDSRLDIAGGALTFAEMTAPSAPAANGCALYVEDNGSGKTRLMALFATGAAQQVAIQP